MATRGNQYGGFNKRIADNEFENNGGFGGANLTVMRDWYNPKTGQRTSVTDGKTPKAGTGWERYQGPGGNDDGRANAVRAAMKAEKRAYENSGPRQGSGIRNAGFRSDESWNPAGEGYIPRKSEGLGALPPPPPPGYSGRRGGGRGFGRGYDIVDHELNRDQPAFDHVQRYPRGYGGRGGGGRGGGRRGGLPGLIPVGGDNYGGGARRGGNNYGGGGGGINNIINILNQPSGGNNTQGQNVGNTQAGGIWDNGKGPTQYGGISNGGGGSSTGGGGTSTGGGQWNKGAILDWLKDNWGTTTGGGTTTEGGGGATTTGGTTTGGGGASTSADQWLKDFYSANNIGGEGGNLDQDAITYWTGEAAKHGIDTTKNTIKGTAIDDGTWNQTGGSTTTGGGASASTDQWLKDFYTEQGMGTPDQEAITYWTGKAAEDGIDATKNVIIGTHKDNQNNAAALANANNAASTAAANVTDATSSSAIANAQARIDAENSGLSNTEQVQNRIKNMYKNVFFRDADQGGLDYWTKKVADGMSLEEVNQQLKDSPEGKGITSGGTNTGATGTNTNAANNIVSTNGSSNASAAADNWLGNFYAEQGLTLDEAGKAHWEKDIKGGATRQDVKNNILKILGKL